LSKASKPKRATVKKVKKHRRPRAATPDAAKWFAMARKNTLTIPIKARPYFRPALYTTKSKILTIMGDLQYDVTGNI
jgi:hypothetical protein